MKRNFLKIVSALSVFLFITAFAACGKTIEKTEIVDDSSMTNSQTEASNTEASSQSLTSETSKTSAQTSTTKVETDSIETILNKIKDYPIGTAGSSYKCVDLALRLINYTENTTDSQGDIEKAARDFFADLSGAEKESFKENLDEIDYMAKLLIKRETSSLGDKIDASKEKYAESYSLDKYENIFEIISQYI